MIKQLVATILAGVMMAPALQQEQAYLAILAETKVARMAGMPVIDLKDMPPGFKLPAEVMMYSGSPARTLNVRLWSPTLAPANATASIAPPAGLKQGAKLDLELYRPEPGATGSTDKVKDFDPDSNPDFTLKIYWGSSETVREGQPKVIKWSDIAPEYKEGMKNRARETSRGNSYFYKPNWTTGYWPTEKQPGQIDPTASLVGNYALTTNYTGNVEIEAPSHVDFLAPLQITSPNLEKNVDLKKAITLNWNEIPHALGLYGWAMGMEGKNTLVLWSSSEVYVDSMMGDMGFLQMAEVRENVQKTIFMPGNTAKVSIPAGIFQNADMAMLNMAGFGPGTALDKAQPLPRIQTKTTLSLMLGGKKMR